MLTASVDTIVSVTGGDLLVGGLSTIANDLVVDSRRVAPGCVFVALQGENVDGHDFGATAIERGARVVVVTLEGQAIEPLLEAAREHDAAVVRVPDAIGALQSLAAYHRSRLHCEVIGVTGSTGKTTTKDFLDAVLSTTLRVVSTEGNRNNEIGVPLTLLRAGADTDVLVVEMGMRGEGQIAELCRVARPTLALVTNVGTSHIELLGSQEAVANAKGELVRAIDERGAVFLNGDDEFSRVIAGTSVAPVTFYGLSESCAVCARDIEIDHESRPSFVLVAGDTSVGVSLPVPGRHNVYNALAAAAVGLHLGVSADSVATGLSSATVSAMRMQVFTSASGVTVVNDAYNANPVSMRAAVETLSGMQCPGRRIAVLGDMAELGSLTDLAHFRIGEEVARLPIDLLVTVGPRARRIGEGAAAEGMDRNRITACDEAEAAADAVASLLAEGDVVLVKASRVMGLERVVEGIVNPS